MEVVIAFRPQAERGREILDELERQTDLQPEGLVEDGTRRYHVDAPDADVDYLDPRLDRIDPEWRNPRDYLAGRRRLVLPGLLLG